MGVPDDLAVRGDDQFRPLESMEPDVDFHRVAKADQATKPLALDTDTSAQRHSEFRELAKVDPWEEWQRVAKGETAIETAGLDTDRSGDAIERWADGLRDTDGTDMTDEGGCPALCTCVGRGFCAWSGDTRVASSFWPPLLPWAP